MDPHAEHEENDADLRQLLRQSSVGDESGCEWPDDHAGNEIADERRQTQSRRGEPEDEREPDTGGKGGDESGFVRHDVVQRELRDGKGRNDITTRARC